MYKTEVLLVLIIILIMTMFLWQTISLRINFSSLSTVTIEYFPIKLILYSFCKRKKRKRKLIKQTKKLLFFLSPIFKSVNFLLERSNLKIFSFSPPHSKSKEPHRYFLSKEINSLSKLYICSILYANSKLSYTDTADGNFSDNDDYIFDFEITTRLYNVFLAFSVLIFYSIKKRGKKKIVWK